uniref:UL36 major tegument protein n=1 Tax=Meleagrid herpesvirus 1 TaxID=37108 RepID=Q9E1F8_MEHV1|nr:UL36 major tegument protein [Meleagrid alphaherpesvirus 1]
MEAVRANMYKRNSLLESTAGDSELMLDRWTKRVVDTTDFSIVAVGIRNQFAAELSPGSSVSCLRSSLAFLRIVFTYGLDTALSADAIDGFLLQGKDWTIHTSDRGVYTTCVPHDLPNRILSKDPGGNLCVAFSSSYGESEFYLDDSTPIILDTQMSARTFVERVWKQKRGDIYCLIVIGVLGIGVFKTEDSVYIFDPHGHGHIGQACIVRVSDMYFYQYLTSYADPSGMPDWSATFVYFVSTAVSAPPKEEIISAVSRLYGTADIVLDIGRADENDNLKIVSADFDPSSRPRPRQTKIVVGTPKLVSEPEPADSHADSSPKLHSESTHLTPHEHGEYDPSTLVGGDSTNINISDPPARTDCRRYSEGSVIHESVNSHIEDVSEATSVPAVWSDASEISEEYSHLGAVAHDPSKNGHDHKPDRRSRGSNSRQKRRRPSWTPPSSSENVSSELPTFHQARRPPRKSKRALDLDYGHLSNEPPDVDGHNSDSPAGAISNISDSIEHLSLRNRAVFNPHTVTGNLDNTLRDSFWNDDYSGSYPLSTISDMIDSITESIADGMRLVVPTSHRDGGVLDVCIMDVFTKLFNYIIENGAQTVTDRASIVEPEMLALTRAFATSSHFSTFLSSTRLSLAEASESANLIESVITEGSRIGKLALSKLTMVALEVEEATITLNKSLDAIEREASTMEPDRIYERMATVLVDTFYRSGKLYSETTSYNSDQTLTNRVVSLCEFIRDRENMATRKAELILAEIEALDEGIRWMNTKFDAFVMGGGGGMSPAKGLSAIDMTATDAVAKKLESLGKAAIDIVGNALREYYSKCALYSAKVMRADMKETSKFKIVHTEQLERMTRLLSSLSIIDDIILLISSRCDARVHVSVSKALESQLLKDLMEIGPHLDVADNLVTWKGLMVSVQTNGWISRRELDLLLEEVDAVNDNAARRETAFTELERLHEIESKIASYTDIETVVDPTKLDEALKLANSIVSITKGLDGAKLASSLSADIREKIRQKRSETELLIARLSAKYAEVKAAVDGIYAAMRKLLRPLQNFAGLRVISSTIKTISDSIIPGMGSFESLLASAPPDVMGALRSDLWVLITQYKTLLARPSTGTASQLSCLGGAFALAIKVILGHESEYHSASVFFGKHADVLSAALTSAASEPTSIEKTSAAVSVLKEAIADINTVDETISQQDIVLSTERADMFSFLHALLTDAEGAADLASRGAYLSTLIRTTRDSSEAVIDAITKIKSLDPKTYTYNTDAEIIVNAKAAVSAATKQAGDCKDALTALDNEPLTYNSHIQRRITELNKLIESVNNRVGDFDIALQSYQRNRVDVERSRGEELWTSSVTSVLVNAEIKSEFDAVRINSLAETARDAEYDTVRFKSRAEKIVSAHARVVENAIVTVLQFNPYSTTNIIHGLKPPIVALKNITWGDAFFAAAPYYTMLFGVNCDVLISLLKVLFAILRYASAHPENLDYYFLVGTIESDLRAIPSLAKYVDFYRRGHDSFEGLLTRLEHMRVNALHASGRVSIEISDSLETLARTHRSEGARRALEYGISIVIPSATTIMSIADALQQEKITELEGTAYAEYSAYILRRDNDAIKAITQRVEAAIEAAKSRGESILKDLAEASYAVDSETAEQLANLKNLLRLVAMPAHIAKAIDKAETAQDIVTQAALLLTKVEESKELDTQTVDWLKHAESVIDSHDLTVRIDGSGPMTMYAERIEALVRLENRLAELKSELALAEAAWDETWSAFIHNRDRIDKSSEGFSAAQESATRAKASTNAINSIRNSMEYNRLPSKIIGSIDSKYKDRTVMLDNFLDSMKEIEDTIRQVEIICSKVPLTFSLNDLRAMSSMYDDIAKRLPKWYVKQVGRYVKLIKIRLALYTAYANASTESIGDPPLLPFDTGRADIAPDTAPSVRLADKYLKHRVAAWMKPKVVATLREAFSEIDMPGLTTFLDSTDTPLRYSICYRTACDKLAACLCETSAVNIKPRAPTNLISTVEMESAAGILNDLMILRLGYVQACADRFQLFRKYVYTGIHDWSPDYCIKAHGTIYCALIATTLTRMTGSNLSDIYFIPGQYGATIEKGEVKKFMANDRRRQVVRLDPADILVTVMACTPGHVVAFSKLDLRNQYGFMAQTLINVLTDAISNVLFVNCLSTRVVDGGKVDPNCRPLSLAGGEKDPSGGALFAIRYSDWKRGRLSDHDPLAPWGDISGDEGAGFAKIRAVVPTDSLLLTTTVLARMCLPPTALAAMWSSMLPDGIEPTCKTYDDVVMARGDGAATLCVTASTIDHTGVINGQTNLDCPSLYEYTGTATTFTVVSTPPSRKLKVNAMDIAACATIFGARIVVAAECPEAFSPDSGLSLCIRLFDSRSGSKGCFVEPGAVSSDITSWGAKLLAADSNPIENACLGQQLELLSHLIASKPLSEAPPCLVIVDAGMVPVKVLWAKEELEPAPIIRMTCADDALIAELPYIDSDVYGEDFQHMHVLDAQEASRFFTDDSRIYPTPIYHTGVDQHNTTDGGESINFFKINPGVCPLTGSEELPVYSDGEQDGYIGGGIEGNAAPDSVEYSALDIDDEGEMTPVNTNMTADVYARDIEPGVLVESHTLKPDYDPANPTSKTMTADSDLATQGDQDGFVSDVGSAMHYKPIVGMEFKPEPTPPIVYEPPAPETSRMESAPLKKLGALDKNVTAMAQSIVQPDNSSIKKNTDIRLAGRRTMPADNNGLRHKPKTGMSETTIKNVESYPSPPRWVRTAASQKRHGEIAGCVSPPIITLQNATPVNMKEGMGIRLEKHSELYDRLDEHQTAPEALEMPPIISAPLISPTPIYKELSGNWHKNIERMGRKQINSRSKERMASKASNSPLKSKISSSTADILVGMASTTSSHDHSERLSPPPIITPQLRRADDMYVNIKNIPVPEVKEEGNWKECPERNNHVPEVETRTLENESPPPPPNVIASWKQILPHTPRGNAHRKAVSQTTHKPPNLSSYRGPVLTEAESERKFNNVRVDPIHKRSESESVSFTDSDSDDSRSTIYNPNSTDTDMSSTSRIVIADTLMTRRDFRKASRGALYALTKACEKIARQITQTRDQLRSRVIGLAADIFKIKMLLMD